MGLVPGVVADLAGDALAGLLGAGGQEPLGVVPGQLPPGEDVGVGAGRDRLGEQVGAQLALDLGVDDGRGAEGEHVARRLGGGRVELAGDLADWMAGLGGR